MQLVIHFKHPLNQRNTVEINHTQTYLIGSSSPARPLSAKTNEESLIILEIEVSIVNSFLKESPLLLLQSLFARMTMILLK